MDLTVEKLVETCLKREYTPAVFNKLLREYRHQKDDHNIDTLFQFSLYPKSFWSLLRRYIYEILIAADFNNTGDDFNLCFLVLKSLSLVDQLETLTCLNQFTSNGKINWSLYLANTSLIDSISLYLKHCVNSIIPRASDNEKLVLMVTKIIITILKSTMGTKLPEPLFTVMKEYQVKLKSSEYEKEADLLGEFIGNHKASTIKADYKDDTPLPNSLTMEATAKGIKVDTLNKLRNKENIKSLKLKVFIWLNQNISVEFSEFDEIKVNEFKNLLNLSNVSTADSVTFMTSELINGLFHGLTMAIDSMKFIWKDFIIWNLPNILKSVFKINQVKLENCLNNIKSTDPNLWSRYHTILLELEKSLVGLDLLKPANSVFGTLASTSTSQLAMTVDELTNQFKQKLIEANPEFTSLKDSNIDEILAEIKPHIVLRQKFNKLVKEAISNFILTNDTLRLRRILICLCIDQEILSTLLLSSTPYKFIAPLLKYFEAQSNSKPENGMASSDPYLQDQTASDLMADIGLTLDDSSNVQSYFNDISVILIVIQFIIKKYSLSLTSNELLELNVPNVLSILTFSPAISTFGTKEDTINKWVLSLFDPSNIEGISDTLIKMSTPLEYAHIMPEIINYAIQCYQFGWLDDEIMNNGLDYFKEGFLSGWLPIIINELCNMEWSCADPKVTHTIIRCIMKLLNNDETENREIKILLDLVKNIINDKVWRSFSDNNDIRSKFSKPNDTLNLRDMLKQTVKSLTVNYHADEEYGDEVTTTVKSGMKSNIESIFSLNFVWESIEMASLPIDELFNELMGLTSQQDISTDLSYEVVALLMVTYSKWKTGSDLGNWVKGIMKIKEHDKNDKVDINQIIYNRATKPVEFTGLEEKTKPVAVSNTNVEDDFFGFIQEPKDEGDDLMEIEEPKVAVPENQDLFASNLFVIMLEGQNNMITGKLIRKIINFL